MRWPLDLRLMLVIGPRDCAGRDLAWVVAEALAGGVTSLQIRDKDQDLSQAEAAYILNLCHERQVACLVNDSVALAKEIGADGVHLGQEDMHPLEARRLLGPHVYLGLSVGSRVEQARLREAFDTVTYVGVGPAFPARSKSDAGPALGPSGLSEVAQGLGKPWVAIGGICAENASQVLPNQPQGLAVVSAISQAADPRTAARTLREQVEGLGAQASG